MVRILLLDCDPSLPEKLSAQGFNVESGTVGYCTGSRSLPSQVYEKDVFIYCPEVFLRDRSNQKAFTDTRDLTPEYSLHHLEERIRGGAIFLIFVNRLSDSVEEQNWLYSWIPSMPKLEFTKDKIIHVTGFTYYPVTEIAYIAPLIEPSKVSYPVLQSLKLPENPSAYKRFVFNVIWNGLGDSLGAVLICGKGALLVVPKYASNTDAIDTFVHRVIPQIFTGSTRGTLGGTFSSPEEIQRQKLIGELGDAEARVQSDLESARVALASANRLKVKTIAEDPTAQQIQIYFDQALRETDAALYYLYKVVEAIENKFGSESAAITAVGERTAWKAVKRLANESYRDARHAPKPTEVIKKWTNQELTDCFADTQKVVLAYFATLFKQ